jgi:hypothetical protein
MRLQPFRCQRKRLSDTPDLASDTLKNTTCSCGKSVTLSPPEGSKAFKSGFIDQQFMFDQIFGSEAGQDEESFDAACLTADRARNFLAFAGLEYAGPSPVHKCMQRRAQYFIHLWSE